jgi:hypothetical protein
MLILIILLSLYIFLRLLIYGIYEIRENENKVAGISMIVISAICLIAPTVLTILK